MRVCVCMCMSIWIGEQEETLFDGKTYCKGKHGQTRNQTNKNIYKHYICIVFYMLCIYLGKQKHTKKKV